MAKKKILTISFVVAFFILMFVYAPLLRISANSAIQTQIQKTNNNINENSHHIPSGATPQANNGPFWTYS